MVRWGGQHGNGRLMANYETTGVGSDCWDHSVTEMPQARWSCLEWHVDVDSNKMRFWVDGAELRDIANDGMGEGCVSDGLNNQWIHPTELNELRLGFDNYQGGAAQTMIIDDVALGTERIGCD